MSARQKKRILGTKIIIKLKKDKFDRFFCVAKEIYEYH